MFQPATAAASASRQAMPVDGASTTKCAVVLQLLALVKQTGFRLVTASSCLSVPCASIMYYSNIFALHTQLNRTNTTYLDVCPLLEPSPSTPSGDYVQPVNVARDIELQTRNLPAPVSFNSGLYIFGIFYIFFLIAMQISGFRYNCNLGGTVNLPAVYNNENSLTCRVNQNQVMHF